MILGVLTTMMNGDNRAWPSQKYLANELRCSTRSVNRYLSHLEIHKWIIINREGGSLRVKDYEIRIPPESFDPDKLSRCQGCQERLTSMAKKANRTYIRKEQLKEHSIAANAAWGRDELKKYLNDMTEGQPSAQLLVRYWSYKGGVGLPESGAPIQFGSKAEIQREIARNVRVANNLLKAYALERIDQTMEIFAEHAPFSWTLETIGKYIAQAPQKIKESLQSMNRKKVHA